MIGAVEAAIIFVMIAFNALFAGYEIALASVSLARLQILHAGQRSGAAAALWMKQNMESSLAVVQLGITFVGAIAAATGGAGAEESIAPSLEKLGLRSGFADLLAIVIVVVPLSIITITVGELIPKVFALRNAEWVCLSLSPIMRWFSVCVRPAVWLFERVVLSIMDWTQRSWQPKLSRELSADSSELRELSAIAALARTSRLIGGREERIILQAASLSSRPVHQIMIPADDIAMLNVDSSMAESLIAAHLDMHTRFPICTTSGDPQSIIGYVNFKDIVSQLRLNPQDPSLRSIVRPIPHVSDDLSIATTLERMIHGHTHIALVRNAAERVVGFITLEDILEELVGDIHDEFDRLPTHILPSGKAWVVGGGTLLARLKDITEVDLTSASPVRTLNDWVIAELGKRPAGGERIEKDDVQVLIRKIRRQKVQEAQVTKKG